MSELRHESYRSEEAEDQHAETRLAGKPKFEVSKDGKSLLCWCDDAEFSRIQKHICDEMRITAATDQIHTTILRHASQRPVLKPLTVRGRIALVGCWLFAAVVVTILLLGIERLFTLIAS